MEQKKKNLMCKKEKAEGNNIIKQCRKLLTFML